MRLSLGLSYSRIPEITERSRFDGNLRSVYGFISCNIHSLSAAMSFYEDSHNETGILSGLSEVGRIYFIKFYFFLFSLFPFLA